jgi:hypothetical protein
MRFGFWVFANVWNDNATVPRIYKMMDTAAATAALPDTATTTVTAADTATAAAPTVTTDQQLSTSLLSSFDAAIKRLRPYQRESDGGCGLLLPGVSFIVLHSRWKEKRLQRKTMFGSRE